MTINAKREVFLLILEEWFNDETGDINEDNYITFRFYLLQILDFEFKFCYSFDNDFRILINKMVEKIYSLENHTKPEELENPELKERILEIYNRTKEEFFLS